MAKVQISADEFARCAAVGMRRFSSSSAKGHNDASTYQRDYYKRLEEEAVGAVGELAFAKYLGIEWSESVDTFHSVLDVGSAEVRATRVKNGCLIVRGNDADDRLFVLVVGDPPEVEVVGWMRAADAKREEWLRDPHGHRPSWFVPQSALGKLKGDVAGQEPSP